MVIPIVLFLLIPVCIGSTLSPQAGWKWLIGFLVGAYGYAALMATLNSHYGFSRSGGDIDIGRFIMALVGALLGSTSGLCVLLHPKDGRFGIGVFALLVALPCLCVYSASFFAALQGQHPLQQHPFQTQLLAKAFAGNGPGMFWSSWLVLRGIWLIRNKQQVVAPSQTTI